MNEVNRPAIEPVTDEDVMVARLTAANGWRPIETAPRDGTVVLFHVPSERLPSMCRADDLLAKPYWLRGATHWMPLPAPPKEPTP